MYFHVNVAILITGGELINKVTSFFLGLFNVLEQVNILKQFMLISCSLAPF